MKSLFLSACFSFGCLLGSVYAANMIPTYREMMQHSGAGRHKEAVKLAERLVRHSSASGGDLVMKGDFLVDSARVFMAAGDARRGMRAAKMALTLAEDREDKSAHALGRAWTAISQAHVELGEIGDAEQSAEKAFLILGKVTYQAITNLIPRCHSMLRIGGSFEERGDFLLAEKYYRKSVSDADEMMGMSYGAAFQIGKLSAAGRAYSSVAGFYVTVGDNERAIPLAVRSLEARAQLVGGGGATGSVGREDTLMTLSRAYLAIGNLEAAEQWAQQAIFMSQSSQIPMRKLTAKSTLLSVICDRGDYAEAHEVARELISLDREMRGQSIRRPHPAFINNLGWVQLRMGNLSSAEQTLRRAYASQVRLGLKDQEPVANILFTLCEVEFLKGNPDRGVMGLRKARGIYEEEFAKLVQFGSDSQKLAFLQKHRSKADFALGVHFGYFQEHTELTQEAFSLVQQRKDRMTALARIAPKDPSHAATSDLETARSKLGLLNLSLGIVNRDKANPFARDWMLEMEKALRTLAVANRGSRASNVQDHQQLSKTLDQDEVLIEYVVYEPYRPKVPKSDKSTIPLHLGVFILTPSGEIHSRDLGEYAPIRKSALTFRQTLAEPGNERYLPLAQNLYNSLIHPIAGLIAPYSYWRVAPDHELLIIPFGALVTSEKRFLGQDRTLTYLASGASLADAPSQQQDGDVVIFVAPDFDGGEPRSTQPSGPENFPPNLQAFLSAVSAQGAPLQFSELPGALEEGKRIQAIFPDAQFLVGTEATEERCKSLRHPKILHIATHGFYLDDELIVARGVRGLKRIKPQDPPGVGEEQRTVLRTSWIGHRSLDHPLLNCGLAFSGSNQLYDGTDDGVLTGMEVLGMDLQGTSLVVLSACETGVGRVLNGQGVMGLRQAFRVAGTSSMVMSLWKVSDQATAILMEQFYQGLRQGKSSGTALREAAASLRDSGTWSHPAYWSAFVLSGQDRIVR